MDDLDFRNSLRERILNDLRNIVKQVYHESVNNELSPENKTYICLTLIKNLDEALRHGLKQLHLGYWKPICEILHPQSLESVERLPVNNDTESNGLMKGKTWIALSLKDDSFNNYIQCLVTEVCLEKYYDDWSILRSNDACNHLLSILSGLDNVRFTFEVEFLNKPPNPCNFGVKNVGNLNLNRSKSNTDLARSSSSLTSPVDSGVHIQDSTSDMEQLSDDKDLDIDFLNGNIPEPVMLRKDKKNAKRHVSFHEDIIYKSPEKCRKLKWDSENLRYSWSGEQIDESILKEADFVDKRVSDRKKNTSKNNYNINERGMPEGEETPMLSDPPKQQDSNGSNSHKSVIVKRFLQSIRSQAKIRHARCKRQNCTNCNYKKFQIDRKLSAEVDEEILREMSTKPDPVISKNEVNLNSDMVKDMIRNQTVYKAYRLRDFLFIITNANLHLINKNLELKRIHFRDLRRVVVYPDSHAFSIQESDEGSELEYHIFVTGDVQLTNEVLGRLEYSMRRNQYDPPLFHMLDHGYFFFVKRSLVDQLAVGKQEEFVYSASVHLYKENDLLNSVLPSSKRGFLMYRHMESGEGWIPGDFCLKNGILYLFGDDTNLPKLAINIATGCQSCNRTKNTDRPHTFQLTLVENELKSHQHTNSAHPTRPKSAHFSDASFVKVNNGKLFGRLRQKVSKFLSFGPAKEPCAVLEFAAANEYELSEWFQMIIQASCEDSCEEAHKDDLVESKLWVTPTSLIITNEVWSPETGDVDIKSCAQLRDVAALKIGECDKDSFVVIEFICMEASSTSGDWILYLSSREELMKLISTLQKYWKFKEKFPCSEMREGRLLNRCRKSQGSLTDNCWIPLLQ